MTTKYTLDVNILRIKDVFAQNTNFDPIQPGQIPQIAEKGQLKWYSTLEFLSTMSIPGVSSSVLDILSSIQPGLSTVAQNLSSLLVSSLRSTVTGLGSANYVSTTRMFKEFEMASLNYRYISAYTLYDCIASLGDLRRIGDNFGPMNLIGSNFSGGYVSTLNPGEFRSYHSTFSNAGSNVTGLTITSSSNIPTSEFRIQGLSTHMVASSKFIVNINGSVNVTANNLFSNACSISSFLIAKGGTTPLGLPVRLDVASGGPSNITIPNLQFVLNKSDLTPFPDALELRHVANIPAQNTATVTTWVPAVGGIFVTLDNLS